MRNTCVNKIGDNMNTIISKRCGELLNEGYHCSEAMIVGVGQMLTPIHPQVIKVSTGFAGGIGSTKDDLCGALTGGIMVIGALHGRADAKANDDECQRLCALYRQQFMQEFGCINCHGLKENWVGKAGQEHCVQLVERAAGLLLGVLGK